MEPHDWLVVLGMAGCLLIGLLAGLAIAAHYEVMRENERALWKRLVEQQEREERR